MEFWKVKNISDYEKEINLYGDIVDEKPWWSGDSDLYITPGAFLEEIKNLANASKLTIRINSGGGDVFVALAIYNQLKGLKAEITVIIDGWCASAATIIASAGDVVKIPKSALFMIHDPTVFAYENFGVEELDKLKNVLVMVKQSIIEVYKTKTNLTEDELSEMMTQETWLSGEKAIELGFCDELLNYEVSVQNNGKYLFVNSVNCGKVEKFKNFPNDVDVTNYTTKEEPNLASIDVEDKSIKEDEGVEETIMTLDELKEKYPDFVNQIRDEGVIAERNRIKDLEEIGDVVDKALLFKAKFEDPKDAGALSLEALKLENKLKNAYSQHSKDDYEKSGVDDIGTSSSSPSNDEKLLRKNKEVDGLVSIMNNDKRRVK